MVLALEFWARSLQFSSNASANLVVFVAKCLGVSWDPLGLAWDSLGPFWDSLGTHWYQIHGSDPWIWSMDLIDGADPWIRSMVLFDLKRKIDFLMSFRDFAELSFFSRASGDNFLRSFSFMFWRCVFFMSEKLMTGNWWLMIDHWSWMIDDW